MGDSRSAPRKPPTHRVRAWAGPARMPTSTKEGVYAACVRARMRLRANMQHTRRRHAAMCVHTCLRCTHRQCPDVRDPRTLKIHAPRCPRYPRRRYS